MFSLTLKSFMHHAAFPGFRQRFSDLFASGFQYIPYFIALVYGVVRLLPANHPYLQPSNMGRFGVRHVIAEAANNLEFSRRNIDQILLFICILMGLALAVLQIGMLSIAVFFQPVMAAMPTDWAGFFFTAAPQQDLAHMMLDLVFGVPDLFNSCIGLPAVPCLNVEGIAIGAPAGGAGTTWAFEASSLPLPVHAGLHDLFRIYNTGLTVVGVFIAIYFIITILLETAESGTPFGKRFNKVWAPIRFAVAFGLLIPINFGYNSSQYIVLYAAKFGSGFATNGWNLFNQTITGTYMGQTRELVAQPNLPNVGGLLQFMFVAKTCAQAQRISSNSTDPIIRPYVVRDTLSTPPHALLIDLNTTYTQFMTFNNGNTQAVIRFGTQDPQKNQRNLGFVAPTCGELIFKLADMRGPGVAEPGVEVMQRYYWFVFKELWYDIMEGGNAGTFLKGGPYFPYPEELVNKHTQFNESPNSFHDPFLPDPPKDWQVKIQDFYTADLREVMSGEVANGATSSGILNAVGGTNALERMRISGRWTVGTNLTDKGWAGAAIWYNLIAEMNGGLSSAALNIPMPSRYPKIMETIYTNKRAAEEKVKFKERFNPVSNIKKVLENLSPTEKKIAPVLWIAFNYWQQGDGALSSHETATGNAVTDIINALFGTEGLFNMRKNSDIHPLAQLTGVGRSLIETSIRNLTYASIGGAGGALLAQIDNFTGASAAQFSSFLITFAMLGLTAGFVLFYIVPFLPFIYFFFALGGWVKGIFEAMVGAPLWALAHLRIDGNGLPGQAAVSGYFLIFEVFLRPILMVFGLLASISIFGALISVLNQVFTLVVANVGGFDVPAEITGVGASKIGSMRAGIDEFFFTIIYTIIVYLMGMSSFKLVDLIPNNILRWMGQSVATFGDQREDSGQSLVGTSTIGSQQTLGAMGGGLQGLAKLGQKGG